MIVEYIIFLTIMMALLWINKKTRNSFFTVSNYLIVTFSIITGIQVIACLLLGYKTATLEYWLILILFIVVALITDILAYSIAKRITINGVKIKQNNDAVMWSEKNEKKFDILCIIAATYSLLHFIKLAGGFPNIYYVVQEEFQSLYANGFNFYVRLLMLIATAYYWGCSKISKKNMILGLICWIPNVLTFVKGIVFIPCLAAIILRMKKGDIRISLKVGVAVVLIGIGIFFGVYLVEMGIYDTDVLFRADTYKMIGAKLINYLIAGCQSFSQNISENNISVFRDLNNITFVPIVNALAKIGIGESIENVSTIWQIFGFSDIRGVAAQSNVNTYVGTLYLFNGALVGCMLNAFWVFLVSFMEEISAEKSNLITAMTSLFCAAFALGWFDLYFVQTFWLYLIVIAVMLEFIFKIRLNVKVKKYSDYNVFRNI